MSTLYRLIATVLLLVSFVQAEDAAPANLTFEPPLNRPLAITVEITQKGDIDVETPETSFADAFEYKSKKVLVDTITARSADETTGTRRYVNVETAYNDEVIDSPLNGCLAQLKRNKEKVAVELLNNRILTNGNLSYMMSMSESLGLPARFAANHKVGETARTSLPELAMLMMGEKLEDAKAEATLQLQSFDPLSLVGKLSGRFEISGKTEEFDEEALLTLVGTLNLEVNASEKRVVSAAFDGTYTYGDAKEKKGRVKGTGSYRASISTEIDKKAAEIDKRSPKFRTRKIHAWRMGLGIKLPSHYATTARNADGYSWVRTLDADKGEAGISLEVLDESCTNPGFVFDKVLAGLRSNHPGTQMKKAKNPFGGEEGRIYYIPLEEGSGDQTFLQTEMYPFRGKFIFYKLWGAPKAYRAALSEFEKARASLGALKGSRK